MKDLTEFRNILVNELQEYAQEYDRAILTIASGAIGLSVVLVKDLAPNPSKDTLWILFVGWASFCISVGSIVTSMLYAISGRKSLIDHIDKAIRKSKRPKEWPKSSKAFFWSIVSSITLVVGIVAYFIFIGSNFSYGR